MGRVSLRQTTLKPSDGEAFFEPPPPFCILGSLLESDRSSIYVGYGSTSVPPHQTQISSPLYCKADLGVQVLVFQVNYETGEMS
jgi:hypothetical protein